MTTLFIDLETYSSVDLKKSTVYRYSEADDFEILMAAWSIDGDEIQVSTGHQEILDDLKHLILDPTTVLVAHNATFERVCLSRILGVWLSAEQWIDTAVLAAEAGLPHTLEKAAKALGVSAKDSAGTRLINLFSKPNREGVRTTGEERPEQWAEFVAYCIQDVRVLIDLYDVLPRLSEAERAAWLTDQAINDRGVTVDLALAAAAQDAAEENKTRHRAEVVELTGVDNPGSVQQLLAWLAESGLELPNLRAETVTATLETDDLSPTQRQVLELRQHLALTTSKKYAAALRSANADGRVRGMFRFHGAHTGRWTSGVLQLHNLSRAQVDNTEAEILDLMLGHGCDDATLKALVRPMLTGPFTIVDFSAIEARVLAWLAGEEWVLDAFRAGRDIYVEVAKQMGGLTRQQGKTAVLACGYGGSIGAMRRMGASGDDEEVKFQVDAWRLANPQIVRLWNAIDSAMRFPSGQMVGRCRWDRVGKSLRVTLPSGRALWYRRVRWVAEDTDEHDEVVRTPSVASDRWARMAYADPRFGTSYAWWGTAVENFTQGVARDLLAEALVRLEAAGYRTVAHVHDEVVVEGTDLAGVSEVMTQVPGWARGLPIAAEGEVASRYKKG